MISERTRAALSHKRSNGYKIGGIVPYGFDVTDDGRLTENPAEQKAIVQIQSLRADGLKLWDIAAELDGQSIKSKTGRKLSAKTVRAILKRVA